MLNDIISKFIESYFNKLNTNSNFKQMLSAKEHDKLRVSDWILTAIGIAGFAFELKKIALSQNVHLVHGSQPVKGDRVYVSISGSSNGISEQALNRLKDQCVRLLEVGCYIIADNWNNASRSHNRLTEGELYTFLKSKGYIVDDKEMYAEWYKDGSRPLDEKILVHNGPGSSLEYHVQQTEFFAKFANRQAIIRGTKDKVRFINFSGVDIGKIDALLGNKLIYPTSGDPYYVPNKEKYSKSRQDIIKMVEFLRKKGMGV